MKYASCWMDESRLAVGCLLTGLWVSRSFCLVVKLAWTVGAVRVMDTLPWNLKVGDAGVHDYMRIQAVGGVGACWAFVKWHSNGLGLKIHGAVVLAHQLVLLCTVVVV